MPGISRHIRIGHRFTSLVPAAQACIEWIRVQTTSLTWLIYVFYKRHTANKGNTEWCGVCGKRAGQTECEKVAMAKIEQGIAESGKSENSEEEPNDWKDILTSLIISFLKYYELIIFFFFKLFVIIVCTILKIRKDRNECGRITTDEPGRPETSKSSGKVPEARFTRYPK